MGQSVISVHKIKIEVLARGEGRSKGIVFYEYEIIYTIISKFARLAFDFHSKLFSRAVSTKWENGHTFRDNIDMI